MAADFKRRIAITPTEPIADEAARISRLLNSGRFTDVHLRHPEATRSEIMRIIEAIHPRFHKQLHLHGHFDLINDFNLGGLHLNRLCPEAPAGFSGMLSCSCHSLDELRRAVRAGITYATLSPIFNSLSKPGYNAAFSHADLKQLAGISGIDIVALGGVTPGLTTALKQYNFAGYAMLTAAWES